MLQKQELEITNASQKVKKINSIYDKCRKNKCLSRQINHKQKIERLRNDDEKKQTLAKKMRKINSTYEKCGKNKCL